MDENRTTRYPLHCRAQVALPNQTVVAGHTIDVSVRDICILLDDQIPIGVSCPLRFEMNVKGHIQIVTALTRSAYSICASHGGFRAGFEFTQDDERRTVLIESLAKKKLMGESTGHKAPVTSAGHG